MRNTIDLFSNAAESMNQNLNQLVLTVMCTQLFEETLMQADDEDDVEATQKSASYCTLHPLEMHLILNLGFLIHHLQQLWEHSPWSRIVSVQCRKITSIKGGVLPFNDPVSTSKQRSVKSGVLCL